MALSLGVFRWNRAKAELVRRVRRMMVTTATAVIIGVVISSVRRERHLASADSCVECSGKMVGDA